MNPRFALPAVAVLLAVGAFFVARGVLPPGEPAPAFPHAVLRPVPEALPLLKFQGVKPEPISPTGFPGRWVWLYTGYASCPDVCPVALSYLADEYQKLAKPEAVKVLFVSVDPQRDTPAKIQDHVAFYDKHFLGVTGPKATIDALVSALHVSYSFDEPTRKGSSYTVSHANLIFVINPQGRLVAGYVPGTKPGDMASDFDALTAE